MATPLKKFSNPDGYKFIDPDSGRITAILDNDGKFSLKDDTGGLETFANWSDFVVKMGDTPASGGEDKILAQLEGFGLGKVEPIDRNRGLTKPTELKPLSPKPTAKPKAQAAVAEPKEDEDVAKKKAAKKAVAKRTPKELHPCPCGCGEKVASQFKQGHDARVHGWAKKIARGEMQLTELKKITQDWMAEHKVKQGTAPAKKTKSKK